MGRSVSYLSHATTVAYIDFDGMYREDQCPDCAGTGGSHYPLDEIGPVRACEYCVGTGANPNPELNEYHWDQFMEDLTEGLVSRYPSLYAADRWDGRETHVFLANDHIEFGVSEYCGLASVSYREASGPYGDVSGLATAHANRIRAGFHAFIEARYGEFALTRAGGFSDGTSVYTRGEKLSA